MMYLVFHLHFFEALRKQIKTFNCLINEKKYFFFVVIKTGDIFHDRKCINVFTGKNMWEMYSYDMYIYIKN